MSKARRHTGAPRRDLPAGTPVIASACWAKLGGSLGQLIEAVAPARHKDLS
jgi:hypothetical protein